MVSSGKTEELSRSDFRPLLSRAVGIPLLLMTILAGALLWQVGTILKTTRWVEHTDQAVAYGYAIRGELVDMESGIRGYALVGHKEFLNPYREAQKTIETRVDEFSGFVTDNSSQVTRLRRLRSTLDQWRGYADEVVRVKESGGDPMPLIASGRPRVLMESMRSDIDAVIQEESALRADRHRTSLIQARWSLILALLSFLIIGAFLAFFSRRQLLQLSRMHHQAQEVLKEAAAREAIHKTEAKYRMLVDSVKDYAILMLDPKGYVTSWNPGAERIKGYQAGEIIGQHFSKFYTLEDVKSGKSEKELETAEHEGRFEDEGWRVRKDGTRFWANVVLTPLRDPDGKLQGYVKVTRDLTEKKKSDEKIREGALALEAANKELEAFSYSVSHDLRAPLRGIDGFSQALMEDYADRLDSVGKDYLQRVRAGVQKMGRLIDDLLNLSRLTRSQLKAETVDLSSISRQVADDLRKTAPDRKVDVRIQDGLVVQGDQGLLGAALQNLISNSWKFSSGKADAKIEIGSFVRDGETIYYVRDNGAGFDMAFVDKLFGAFQRLHRATEFSGTGVGLATVRRIVHRHGGKIWAEGKVGEGATFYFTLNPVLQDRGAA